VVIMVDITAGEDITLTTTTHTGDHLITDGVGVDRIGVMATMGPIMDTVLITVTIILTTDLITPEVMPILNPEEDITEEQLLRSTDMRELPLARMDTTEPPEGIRDHRIAMVTIQELQPEEVVDIRTHQESV
jgi:hypothetical protein